MTGPADLGVLVIPRTVEIEASLDFHGPEFA